MYLINRMAKWLCNLITDRFSSCNDHFQTNPLTWNESERYWSVFSAKSSFCVMTRTALPWMSRKICLIFASNITFSMNKTSLFKTLFYSGRSSISSVRLVLFMSFTRKTKTYLFVASLSWAPWFQLFCFEFINPKYFNSKKIQMCSSCLMRYQQFRKSHGNSEKSFSW